MTKLVLTAQENGVEPQSLFTCQGRIHGYLTLPQKAIGPHRLEAKWFGPKKSLEHHTQVSVDFPPPGRQTAYVWLQFDEEGGLFRRPIDGTANWRDRERYHGAWQVEVFWDEAPLIKTPFQVRCE